MRCAGRRTTKRGIGSVWWEWFIHPQNFRVELGHLGLRSHVLETRPVANTKECGDRGETNYPHP